MKYKLKLFNESNNNEMLRYMRNLIMKKYAAKFQALRAKMMMINAQYAELQAQLFKELHDAELKVNDDIKKSIQQNKRKSPFHTS